MKLKCDKHDRRVLTTSRGFEHRTGDLSVCDSETATMVSPKEDLTYAIDNDGGLHLAFVDGKPVFDLSSV